MVDPKMNLDKGLIAEYNAVAQEAQAMTFLTRALDLQEAAVARVDNSFCYWRRGKPCTFGHRKKIAPIAYLQWKWL